MKNQLFFLLSLFFFISCKNEGIVNEPHSNDTTNSIAINLPLSGGDLNQILERSDVSVETKYFTLLHHLPLSDSYVREKSINFGNTLKQSIFTANELAKGLKDIENDKNKATKLRDEMQLIHSRLVPF